MTEASQNSEVEEALKQSRQTRMHKIAEESVERFEGDEIRLDKRDLHSMYHHAREIAKIALELNGSGQSVSNDVKVSASIWRKAVEKMGAKNGSSLKSFYSTLFDDKVGELREGVVESELT